MEKTQEFLQPLNKEFYKLLLEGRVETVKKKFPFINDDSIQYFAQNDPSGNNKYLLWMVERFVAMHGGISGEEIVSLVKRFHNSLPKLANKDLYAYKTFKDLRDALEVIGPSKKELKSEAKKYYEDKNFLVIEPDTEKASCYYGRETKWCISATETENHFNQYHQVGARFLFFIKKHPGDKDSEEYDKMAVSFVPKNFDLEGVDFDFLVTGVWDALDNMTSLGELKKNFPPQVIEALQKEFKLLDINDLPEDKQLEFVEATKDTIFRNQPGAILLVINPSDWLQKKVAGMPFGQIYDELRSDFDKKITNPEARMLFKLVKGYTTEWAKQNSEKVREDVALLEKGLENFPGIRITVADDDGIKVYRFPDSRTHEEINGFMYMTYFEGRLDYELDFSNIKELADITKEQIELAVRSSLWQNETVSYTTHHIEYNGTTLYMDGFMRHDQPDDILYHYNSFFEWVMTGGKTAIKEHLLFSLRNPEYYKKIHSEGQHETNRDIAHHVDYGSYGSPQDPELPLDEKIKKFATAETKKYLLKQGSRLLSLKTP